MYRTGRESTTSNKKEHTKEDNVSNIKQQNTRDGSTNVTYEMFLPDTKTDFDFLSLAKATA